MIIFVYMTTVRGVFLLILLQLFCESSDAQFSNILISQKPKPKVTRSEMESDSAHYIDKPNTFRDKKTNVVHSVWTEFDKYKSGSSRDSSFIMYSNMHGKTWSKAQRISKFPGDCNNSDNTLKADNPCPGAMGEIYICWAGPKGLAFQRSLDTGKTWLPEEKFIADIKNGWDQEVDGLKTTGLPRITCAVDSGQFQGRIYITWSDEKNGVKNKDVFLVYSDNNGDNWTEPILVTYRPNHKEQFNPAIAVQPGTNNLFITYFDKQNYLGGNLSDLYLAVSKNGGLKFDYYRLNEKPVLQDSNVVSVRGLGFVPKTHEIKAIWSQVGEDNKLSIYSALMNDSTIQSYSMKDSASEIHIQKTYSFSKKIKLEFEVPEKTEMTAVLSKPLEPGFEKTVFKKIPLVKGKNELTVDTKKLGIVKGNYVMTFYYLNRNSFIWITEN